MRLSAIALIGTAVFSAVAGVLASTNALPGITFYGPEAKLPGKLVFAYSAARPPYLKITTNMASIYEFDLESQNLRELIKAPIPTGGFATSDDGKGFCLIFEDLHHTKNAFVYWDDCPSPRTVTVGGDLVRAVLLFGHAFFNVKATNGTRVHDLDISSGAERVVTMAGASVWQYQDYGNIHAGRGGTNGLHFEYNAYGKRLSAGVDYEQGYYKFDPTSGDIRWISKEDDEASAFERTADGRYVFFKEGSGTSADRTLVVGTREDALSEPQDLKKSKSLRVLKSFSTSGGAGINLLLQMSPCGRFAFVKHAVTIQVDGLPHWVKTYYVVEVDSGKTIVLLEDQVARTSGGFLSDVRWVATGAATRPQVRR
jgi:hypothetical protein